MNSVILLLLILSTHILSSFSYHLSYYSPLTVVQHKERTIPAIRSAIGHAQRLKSQTACNAFPAGAGFDLQILSDQFNHFISTSSIPSESESGLGALGKDFLAFLCATICIVPLFKWLKASSVIG